MTHNCIIDQMAEQLHNTYRRTPTNRLKSVAYSHTHLANASGNPFDYIRRVMLDECLADERAVVRVPIQPHYIRSIAKRIHAGNPGIPVEELVSEGYYIWLNRLGSKPIELNNFVYTVLWRGLIRFSIEYQNLPWWQGTSKKTRKKLIKHDVEDVMWSSLNAPAYDDDENTEIVDTLEDYDASTPFEQFENKELLDHILIHLDKRNREAFILYYGYNTPLHVIATIQGCSKQAVHERLHKSLNKLQELTPNSWRYTQ